MKRYRQNRVCKILVSYDELFGVLADTLGGQPTNRYMDFVDTKVIFLPTFLVVFSA